MANSENLWLTIFNVNERWFDQLGSVLFKWDNISFLNEII